MDEYEEKAACRCHRASAACRESLAAAPRAKHMQRSTFQSARVIRDARKRTWSCACREANITAHGKPQQRLSQATAADRAPANTITEAAAPAPHGVNKLYDLTSSFGCPCLPCRWAAPTRAPPGVHLQMRPVLHASGCIQSARQLQRDSRRSIPVRPGRPALGRTRRGGAPLTTPYQPIAPLSNADGCMNPVAGVCSCAGKSSRKVWRGGVQCHAYLHTIMTGRAARRRTPPTQLLRADTSL